jgi:hypothetical protein
VDPVYRVRGGGPPEALKISRTFSDKNHSNGLQHYHSTLGADLVSCTHQREEHR